jgi:hypothetical protein
MATTNSRRRTRRGMQGVDLAEWVVCTSHFASRAAGAREPWERHHARRSGDAFTACGLPCLGWPVFWHLPFSAAAEDFCSGCLELCT